MSERVVLGFDGMSTMSRREVPRAVSVDLVLSVYPPARGIRMDGVAAPAQFGLDLEPCV